MGPNSSERKRVREVRKYYNRSPNDPHISGTPLPLGHDGFESSKGISTTAVSSPNKTLTALMQLIACRLGIQRAMVSVVDENAQYFLAESTKTLDLIDPLKHDEGDELWMGCSGTVRSEALCANTIQVPPKEDGYACFSVSDLAQDPKFCKLPYVAGPPFFRFYAGTPLLTKNNVPIGSVFVIDTRARGPPTQFEIDLLGIMAKNVMEYLEMRRESEMRKRTQIMSRGLASLVDGKFSIFPLEGVDNPKQPCCMPEQTAAGLEILPTESTDTCASNPPAVDETSGRPTHKSTDDNTTSISEPSWEKASMNRISASAEAIFGGRLSCNTESSLSENYRASEYTSAIANESLPQEQTMHVVTSLEGQTTSKSNPQGSGISMTDTFRNESCCSPRSCSNEVSVTPFAAYSHGRKLSLSKYSLTNSQRSSYLRAKSDTREAEDIQTHEQIVHKAANLLRESLDVDYTLFLDVIQDFTPNSTSEESTIGGIGTTDDQRPVLPFRQDSGICLSLDLEPKELSIRRKRPTMPVIHSSRSSQGKDASAKLVSFSSQKVCSLIQEEMDPQYGFKSPACRQLRRLLKRYPEGKLWTFNDEGAESSDEEDSADDHEKSATRATKLSETRFIIQCFPGARQILFAPLFNVEKSVHVAACFCVCLEPTPIFTPELELAFLRAFMNNVSVACNQSSMASANRLKGDFISSISHELRSPLHGILASVELLSSSSLDRPQKENCNTISTCGQALLETITSILEYTKINTLKKDSQVSVKSKDSRPLMFRHGSSEQKNLSSLVPDLPASSNVDIAKVCEDSCLLVAAAHMHHISTPDQPLYRVFVPPEAAHQLNGDVSTAPAPVVIILDVAPGNWKLVAMSGSIIRIISNLVGNSLKYTSSGFIKVKLDIVPVKEESDQNKGSTVVVLNVIDTGKGIGPLFLKTKLFSPFSQETILAPGTGLGLHLVKSLVQMHDGSIDVESEVGVGTHVTVRMRLQQAPVDCEAPESGLQLARNESDDSIDEVRKRKKNKTFLLYGFHSSTDSLIKDSLHLYLTSWFGMSVPPEDEEPAIVFTNEDRLASCLSFVTLYRKRPQVIVVCDQKRQKHLNETHARVDNSLELLTIPFGPYKLSKALLACKEVKTGPEQPPTYLNGFHIPNSDAVKFAERGMQSPVAYLESPHSSGGNSFPWTAPATQMPIHIYNLRDLPTPIPGATLPTSLPTPVTPFPLLPQKAAENNPGNSIVDSTQPRVLCVDDNPINLRLLKTFMEKVNFRNITCAENGSLAFEAVRCQKESFDLIFMDLSMPICDGFQAITLIRTLEKINQDISPPNFPPPKTALIVALTGLASQRDQDAAREAGADHYITKPMKLSLPKKLLPEWGILAEGQSVEV